MLRKVTADLIVPLVDVLLSPLIFVAAVLMKVVRRLGIWRMPISKRIFNRIGVFPIRDHYYEPMFNHSAQLVHSLEDERQLPGIDMNEATQLELLACFDYAEELKRFPIAPMDASSFYYRNPNFVEGDAECLYSLIRLSKPKRIVEIGSGFSTMMARHAIAQNMAEDISYQCRHVCIEPYEMGWLRSVPGIELLRQRVEQMDRQIFRELEKGDILFIDSSHMIRPQGDVLCECLEILPILQAGVMIHFHDIFTPRDYLARWLLDEVKLWNEQYLLEAFMSYNSSFEVVAALNFLKHHHPARMAEKFPMLAARMEQSEPGSFWIRKVI